jgi:hypothetical protein
LLFRFPSILLQSNVYCVSYMCSDVAEVIRSLAPIELREMMT